MAVIPGVAEILPAAVVLVQDLDVIQAALLKEGRVGLVQQLAPYRGGGADVVALSLGGADLTDNTSVGALAHTRRQALLLVVVHGGVIIHQMTLGGVAEARAVHPQHIPLAVKGVAELAEALHPAVGRPDEGGRPGSGPLPVHEDHHETALGGHTDAVQHGQGIGVREHGIGIHDVGIVPAADGVGHDQRGITVPCGESLIPHDLPRLGRQMPLKPPAVDLGGRLPPPIGGLPDQGIVGLKMLAEVHTAEKAGLEGGPTAVTEEVQSLDPTGGIVCADIQPAVLPEIGHHLGGDHVGEQGVAPEGGVLGIPEAEVGRVTLQMAGDQNALVVGEQDLTARHGSLPLQIGQGHTGEIHPLGKGIPRVGVHGHAPPDTAVLLGQSHGDGQILKGRGKIAVQPALFGLGAGAGFIGGIVVGLPRLIAETDTEQGRGGYHTLHTVQDQGRDMPRGEVHR